MMLARLMLLLTAFIWGSTFVAQRISTDTIGPFSYNMIRFFIGSLALLPVMSFFKDSIPTRKAALPFWMAAALAGFFLFAGASLQQIGLAGTTASKAGFITALYIVFVPIIGLFLGHRLPYLAILGVILAVLGLFFMTMGQSSFTMEAGDFLITVSTLFWAGHILLLTYLSPRYPGIKLAAGQFLFCSLFSGVLVLFTETLTPSMIKATLIPLLYGGLLSVAIGFTLQLIAQKKLPPTEASLLMSLEMVFSALTGYLILGETLNTTELLGAILLSFGILLAQIPTSPKWSISLHSKVKRLS